MLFDNHKTPSRLVAMMVPDYAHIGEISLFSFSYENAVATFKLCFELLSLRRTTTATACAR